MNDSLSSGTASGHLRIGVVGSCQVVGLASWIRRLVPESTVDAWHVGVNEPSMPSAILQRLSGKPDGTIYNLIVTQVEDGQYECQLDIERLRELCGNVVFLPIFLFRGFHPDAVMCFDNDGGLFLNKRVGLFHSAIVVAAFELGMPVARVPAMFNSLVFGTAKYDTVFPAARAALLKNFAERGYNLEDAFGEWMHEGAFMYTDNHPHIRVLGTLAKQALTNAGIQISEVKEVPEDSLSNSLHWPIYVDFARRLGIGGSNDFLRAMDNVPVGETRGLTLDAWVNELHHAYSATSGLKFYPSFVMNDTRAALETLYGRG